MTDRLLAIIQSKYALTELDVGDFATLKANGMKFTVNAYKAEGLGHISVMRAKGFFGLMKMDTLIINPKELDFPLYSYDRIYAMGNDTLIVELYDTLCGVRYLDGLNQVKAKYAELPERDPGKHWYDGIKLPESISKKGKKAQTTLFDKFTVEHLEAYLELEAADNIDVAEKQKKASCYVEGLLKNGGPSTDVFKKELGEDKTSELFQKILFGTAEK